MSRAELWRRGGELVACGVVAGATIGDGLVGWGLAAGALALAAALLLTMPTPAVGSWRFDGRGWCYLTRAAWGRVAPDRGPIHRAEVRELDGPNVWWWHGTEKELRVWVERQALEVERARASGRGPELVA